MYKTKPIGRPKVPVNARARMMGVSLPPDMETALRAFAESKMWGISQTVKLLLSHSPDPDWQRFLSTAKGELIDELRAARAKEKEKEKEEERKALADPHWNPAKAAHRAREMRAGRPDPYEPVADDGSDDDVEI